MVTDTTLKLKILDKIYAVYDKFAASQDLACQKYCDHCCTSAVTLTTLEGYKIIDRLISDSQTDFLQKINSISGNNRLRPQITTNRLARLCADGVEPLEETSDADPGNCPILAEHLCRIYELRPFGCRCLVSRRRCRENGYAEMDDFILSVNTVFLQTIEHVDAEGCSGNLVDVLQVMSIQQNRESYSSGKLHCTGNGLIANQPLEVLMIPPEHRQEIEPILQELRQIRI